MQANLLTIPHTILSNSNQYPNDIAMREKKFGVWKTKTWKQTYDEIKAISLALKSKGVKEKSTVAILGNNTPRWVIAETAAQSLRSIALGLYSDALENEIEYLLELTSCEDSFC